MREISEVVEGLKPTILMVMAQMSFVGVNVLYKLAVSDGMNLKFIIAYRFTFATAFMAILTLIFERNKRPKMTWTILFQALLCGLLGGTLAQTLNLATLALTSLTFTSAMNNLSPAITFLVALCFRVEKLNLGTTEGKAKIMGTLVGIGGAMLLTFYKGPQIDTPSFHVNLLRHHSGHVTLSRASSNGRTVLGALCALGGNLSYALWLIVQGKMSEKYPCYYSSTALMNVMASAFSVAFALCTERNSSKWRLGWNIRLLTVTYAGLVPAGITAVIIVYCVQKRGPLFVSIFSPLLLLMLALVETFFLDEKLHLGSIIGGVLIVCGLYLVLWGKGEEMKKNLLMPSSESLHVSSKVKVIVKSPEENDKSNHDNSINTSNVARDREDSSQNESDVVHDSGNRRNKGEVVSRN